MPQAACTLKMSRLASNSRTKNRDGLAIMEAVMNHTCTLPINNYFINNNCGSSRPISGFVLHEEAKQLERSTRTSPSHCAPLNHYKTVNVHKDVLLMHIHAKYTVNEKGEVW